MRKLQSFDERQFARLPESLNGEGQLGFAATEILPTIRTRAPVAPGSETSAEAAEAMEQNGRMTEELRRVLIWYAAQSEPRTTHEMAAVLYPDTGTGSACPRVSELVFRECLQRVGRQGKRSTLIVTAKGRQEADRLARRSAAA